MKRIKLLMFPLVGLIGFSGCTGTTWNEQISTRVANYEVDYLKEYEDVKKRTPVRNVEWVQPKNKIEPCKVYVGYNGDKNPIEDNSYKLFWDGECKDGYAYGLGREIENANLIDRWQIGIYEKGIPNGNIVVKDNLTNYLAEAEANYSGSTYGVGRIIIDNNGEFNVTYRQGRIYANNEPYLYIETSPFKNPSKKYIKSYPNFSYVLNYDSFYLFNKKSKKKHGWAIEKQKYNSQIGEYINGIGQEIKLPSEYHDKANQIVNEISQASDRGIQAQKQAQLVKKQYLKKICKDSTKVDFMDNDEYKEICDDKKEQEIITKINANISQQQEERYRQGVILDREIANYQQTRAIQDASDAVILQNINQTIQNMNSNSQKQQENFQLFQLNDNLNNLNNTIKKW